MLLNLLRQLCLRGGRKSDPLKFALVDKIVVPLQWSQIEVLHLSNENQENF
jgi:hypothetical protein